MRAEVQRQNEEHVTNILAVAYGTNTSGEKLKKLIKDIMEEKTPKGSFKEPDTVPKNDGIRLAQMLKTKMR